MIRGNTISIFRLLLLWGIALLFGTPLFAQKEKADSCSAILKQHPDDRKTRRSYCSALRKINLDSAFAICKSNAVTAEQKGDQRTAGDWYYGAALALDGSQKNDSAKVYFQKSIAQLDAVKDTFSLDDAQNNYGYLLLRMGEYKESLKQLNASLAYREYVNDTAGKAACHLHMGLLYNNMGDYTQALDHYFQCVELAKFNEESDPAMMGKVMNNIGTVYMNQNKYADALRFFRSAIVYKEKANNPKELASTYNNIGSIYLESDLDSALYFFRISLDLRTQAKDFRGLGIVHKNMGEAYFRQEKYKEAEENFNLSLTYREKVSDKVGVASTLVALGKLKDKQGRYSDGLALLLRADSIASAAGALTTQLDAAMALWSIYRDMGNPTTALTYAELAINLKDSLLNESSVRHGEEMKARYDMDQQAKELEALKLQQREDAIKAESEGKFYQLLIVAGAIVLVLVVVFFLIRARETKKAQSRLQFAYDQIETKNKDITDSIRYAKRIQQAILPDDQVLRQAFPDSFVFYRPKDIVSGDFYWHHHTEEIQLVAVADCTGHGVPGAFMSVLGASQLTSVIAEQGQLAPSRILNLIDEGIRQQLHQDGLSATHDSMDIALCAYNKKKGELTFCGANRPIIVFRKTGQLEIFRPSKFSVGGDSEMQKVFQEQTISLNAGDCFYLFTDGFADQFGGAKGKKFKTSRFRDMLTQIAAQEIRHQKQELETVFDSWRGQFEQVDDICVVGIRV